LVFFFQVMAKLFVEVFGDSLITSPLEKNESFYPSPEALRNKIIVKHKKIGGTKDTNYSDVV
jgi:phosphatidylinositol phospholipase C gamma-1